MQEGNGTTKSQALKNLSQREAITAKPDVTRQYQVYTLPEGCASLDKFTASNHVRHVINEMKKKHYGDRFTECFVSFFPIYSFI